MRDINILKGEERMNHYLPLAQAILEGIFVKTEWAHETGWDREIAHYLDKMEWYAHDYAGDMECGEVKDREDMLADIYDEYLRADYYTTPGRGTTPMIVWEYDDDLVLVGLPKFQDCIRCAIKEICEKDYLCGQAYEKIITLTAEDTEPEEWKIHKEDWKIAKTVGVLQRLPEHWELMYKEALDK